MVEPPVGTAWRRQCSRCMLWLSCTSHLRFDATWHVGGRFGSFLVRSLWNSVGDVPGQVEVRSLQDADSHLPEMSRPGGQNWILWYCANTPFTLVKPARQHVNVKSITTGQVSIQGDLKKEGVKSTPLSCDDKLWRSLFWSAGEYKIPEQPTNPRSGKCSHAGLPKYGICGCGFLESLTHHCGDL